MSYEGPPPGYDQKMHHLAPAVYPGPHPQPSYPMPPPPQPSYPMPPPPVQAAPAPAPIIVVQQSTTSSAQAGIPDRNYMRPRGYVNHCLHCVICLFCPWYLIIWIFICCLNSRCCIA